MKMQLHNLSVDAIASQQEGRGFRRYRRPPVVLTKNKPTKEEFRKTLMEMMANGKKDIHYSC